jgi:hypothetical protein
MLVNYWDKYTEMHGQQNLKKYLKISLIISLTKRGNQVSHPDNNESVELSGK